MAIHLPTNPFRGINPLLNSLLQGDHYYESGNTAPSVWPSFHAAHIVHIADALNERLIPLGYVAFAEQGLQIQTGGSFQYPDDAVYDPTPGKEHPTPAATALAAAPSATLVHIPVDEIIEMARTFKSVTIYPTPQEHPVLGKPITRIELLSPTNKRGGNHYLSYVRNRAEAVQSGTAIIEIDYLHESTPPYPDGNLPRYPKEKNSYPYYIAVTNIRLRPVEVVIQPFGVDEPIPAIEVPLAKDITLSLDLDAVYQHTYQVGAWPMLIDFEQEPERLNTYSTSDQNRIRQKLDELRGAHRPGA
jgi:hypothetical protein